MKTVQPHALAHRLALPALSVLLLAGCATVQKAPIQQADINCGLLGKYCNQLKPGTEEQMGMRYVNPAVNWSQYKKVLIAPVTLWGGEQVKLSATDQQALVDYFQKALKEQFAKQFQVVDVAEPNTMTVTAALTDPETATPVLRSISMIVPQARTLSTVGYLTTGKYPFVGGAQVEAKLTDSVSGEVLAAAVDKRIGGGNISTGFQWQWGDVENAMDFWAEKAATRLHKWTTGEEKP